MSATVPLARRTAAEAIGTAALVAVVAVCFGRPAPAAMSEPISLDESRAAAPARPAEESALT